MRINDQRINLPEIRYRSDILLRPYQKPTIQTAIEAEQGILIAPCGSGKTEIGHEIIAALKQPALWLTHTIDLLNQSAKRGREKLHLSDEQIGIMGDGKKNTGTHITYATVQTLNRLTDTELQEFAKYFGTVIVDEAHRAVAGVSHMKQFERVLSFMSARYRFGLTASEHRADGLMQTVFMILGEKFYEIRKSDIEMHLMTPAVQFVKTEYRFAYDPAAYDRFPFSTMLSDMALDADRNESICRLLNRMDGHSVLVLGDSLKHLEALMAGTVIGPVEYINGGTNRNDRNTALKRMYNGTSKVLFATYALAKEGLDIPRLDRLFLVTPKKDRTVVEQAVGRVARKSEGKEDVIVYDFWDENMKLCTEHARARVKQVYQKLGCIVSGGPIVRAKQESELPIF
ncbi:MAG: DEAD/DEAH box helicase [Candidatus Methanomethylophilaceae archaeon]